MYLEVASLILHERHPQSLLANTPQKIGLLAVQTLDRDAEERSAGKALEDEVGAKLLQQGSPRPVSNKEEEETLKLLLESGNADLLA